MPGRPSHAALATSETQELSKEAVEALAAVSRIGAGSQGFLSPVKAPAACVKLSHQRHTNMPAALLGGHGGIPQICPVKPPMHLVLCECHPRRAGVCGGEGQGRVPEPDPVRRREAVGEASAVGRRWGGSSGSGDSRGDPRPRHWHLRDRLRAQERLRLGGAQSNVPPLSWIWAARSPSLRVQFPASLLETWRRP